MLKKKKKFQKVDDERKAAKSLLYLFVNHLETRKDRNYTAKNNNWLLVYVIKIEIEIDWWQNIK